jgi:UDP-glucose 4-epimerase
VVDGTATLLEALRKHAPRARVVYVSSAAVYGDPPVLPVTEEAPTRPLSPYGYHRLMAELLVEEACRLQGAWGAIARVFSAYGPGLSRQVVFDLCSRGVRHEELVLDGTGDESRDFVHGSDVARALLAIAEGGSGQGERYNVASGVETTIRALADLVARETGAGPVQFTGRVRAGDPKRWRADVSRLQRLGFMSRKGLEEGVREVVDWLRDPALGAGGAR